MGQYLCNSPQRISPSPSKKTQRKKRRRKSYFNTVSCRKLIEQTSEMLDMETSRKTAEME